MNTRLPLLIALVFLASAAGAGAEREEMRAKNAPAKSPDASAIALDAREAVLRALERSPALRVERLRPARVRTAEEQERAAFDPTLSAEISVARDEEEVEKKGQETADQSSETEAAGVTVEEFLPTGTRLSLGADLQETEKDGSGAEARRTRYTLSAVQSLLRGLGPAVNLASLRQARLATRISRYELRGFAEALAEEAESAYWACFLAEKRVEISQRSLELAEAQRDEVRERIRLGQIAAVLIFLAAAAITLYHWRRAAEPKL
ncbi:MAG: TolC family protein [Planctomycetota bacterium]|nr:TolC family protein [Planctomycetota bacterium]